ncbi:MAG TPA: hypothetical protein V6C96_03930 [Vampirovibrionales bacterium]
MKNPFQLDTKAPLVFIKGQRKGYLQIATSEIITKYKNLPDYLLLAAKDWVTSLEGLGAKKVYWISLSEVVEHLHIHLYPRWSDTESKGIQLFEERNNSDLKQPNWTTEEEKKLYEWVSKWKAEQAY